MHMVHSVGFAMAVGDGWVYLISLLLGGGRCARDEITINDTKRGYVATNPIKVQGTSFESGMEIVSALDEARAGSLTSAFRGFTSKTDSYISMVCR